MEELFFVFSVLHLLEDGLLETSSLFKKYVLFCPMIFIYVIVF